jgi:hypothetical protein
VPLAAQHLMQGAQVAQMQLIHGSSPTMQQVQLLPLDPCSSSSSSRKLLLDAPNLGGTVTC